MKKAGASCPGLPFSLQPFLASRLHEIEVGEVPIEYRRGGGLEPLVEQGGVDGAEVGVHPQVAVVEVRQAGVLAVDATLDRATRQEQDAGRAVVRS